MGCAVSWVSFGSNSTAFPDPTKARFNTWILSHKHPYPVRHPTKCFQYSLRSNKLAYCSRADSSAYGCDRHRRSISQASIRKLVEVQRRGQRLNRVTLAPHSSCQQKGLAFGLVYIKDWGWETIHLGSQGFYWSLSQSHTRVGHAIWHTKKSRASG